MKISEQAKEAARHVVDSSNQTRNKHNEAAIQYAINAYVAEVIEIVRGYDISRDLRQRLDEIERLTR